MSLSVLGATGAVTAASDAAQTAMAGITVKQLENQVANAEMSAATSQANGASQVAQSVKVG